MTKIIMALFILCSTAYTQNDQKFILSLQQAYEYALQHNPSYRIQLKKIDSQRGIYWHEMTLENLEIGVEVEEVPEGRSYSDYGERRLFVSQEIDFPTTYWLKHKLLNLDVQKAVVRLDVVKREIFFQVKQAYYNLLLHRVLEKLALKNFQLSKDFCSKVQKSHELGETDRLNMLKARVRLGEATQMLKGAQKDIDVSVSNLKAALGIQTGEELIFVLVDSLPEAITEVNFEQLRQRLLMNPAFKSAKLEVAAAVQAKRLAYNELLPKLSFSYFKQQINREKFWGGEIGLSVPLWLMKPKGMIQQKRAEHIMAEQFYLAEQIRLQNEFDQAIAKLEKASGEVRLFQADLLKEADEIFRTAQQSYAVGEIGYLDYIDAQQTLIQTQKSYWQSLYTYHVEKANLARLTGID